MDCDFLSFKNFKNIHPETLLDGLNNTHFPQRALCDTHPSHRKQFIPSVPSSLPPASAPRHTVRTQGRKSGNSTSCGTSHPATPGQWPLAPRPDFARSLALARSACRTQCKYSAGTRGVFWTLPEQSSHPVPLWEGLGPPPASEGFPWEIKKVNWGSEKACGWQLGEESISMKKNTRFLLLY